MVPMGSPVAVLLCVIGECIYAIDFSRAQYYVICPGHRAPTPTPHPPSTPSRAVPPCHSKPRRGGRESATRMGDTSELLALVGAIGTTYEGPGQGGQQGGRQGTPRTPSYCPSHGMPQTGHRGTRETRQKFRGMNGRAQNGYQLPGYIRASHT